MYNLNSEHAEILDKANQIADAYAAPHAADVDANSRFPKEAMQALAENGFYGLTISKEFGGLGGDLRLSIAVIDAISQRCSSTGMVYLMHLAGISAYNAHPESTADYLKAAAQGKHLTTLAWSEKGSRSHFWAPVSRVAVEGDELVLNAEKSWVTSAGIADGYVVTTGGDPEGIDLVVIENQDAGLTVAGPWNALGMRGNASSPMTLSNLRIPTSRRLGAAGGAFGTMMGAVLPQFQLGNAAVSIGTSEAATSATLGHLTNQSFAHLGQKLADLPNLRARLASMRMQTDAARAHIAATLNAIEAGSGDAMLLVLQSKAVAAETAIRVTDIGMRACGGAAFSKHLSLERNFRDARAMAVMAPTSDAIHDFVGRALCGMELFS